MEEIIAHIKERFPLLRHLFVEDSRENLILEPMAPYLGILLAVFSAVGDKPICFVLPRCGEMPRLAAILYGMVRFAEKYPILAEAYAKTAFNPGDRVRVNPSRHVFIYDGLQTENSGQIWLRSLREEGRQTFPVSEVLRLERTERTLPVGKTTTRLWTPPPALLDTLLGINTGGNKGLIENEVVLLDYVGGFTDFVESVRFQPDTPINDAHNLKNLLSFGELSKDGSKELNLKKWDEMNPTGEPLIAVTHDAELVAEYCIQEQFRSKFVMVNGLGRFRNNRQAYDDIAASQKLILFADHDEEEMIETLGSAPTPCSFWVLGDDELLHGISSFKPTGILNSVSRWACNYNKLNIDSVPCDNPHLDNVFLKLEKLRSFESDSDDTPLTKHVSRAWRFFNDACSLIVEPVLEEKTNALSEINLFRNELVQNKAWLSPDIAIAFEEFADAMQSCYYQEKPLGNSKGDALYSTLLQALEQHKSTVLLARNENKAIALKAWIKRHVRFNNIKVYSPRTLPSETNVDRLICVSWLGGDLMKQVVSKLTSPHITLIGYACERHWLKQCQSRFKRKPQAPLLSRNEKSSLIAGNKHSHFNWTDDVPVNPPITTDASKSDIWAFEHRLRSARIGLAARPTEATETVPSRYVRFAGDTYSFLTESHKLAIATALVSGQASANQKLPERTVVDIKPGDFIVFPESGDRELVHELADKLIGSAAVGLRKNAHLWKDALKLSGITTEQFQAKAGSFNHHRHPATIRNWFADTSQIGPREKDDLLLIALVTGNQQLETEMESVWTAIESLRSTHLSAGMRLRDLLLESLPRITGQIEETGTKVELADLGSAWIVQVDSIASNVEPRGRNEVNRLLFEDSV